MTQVQVPSTHPDDRGYESCDSEDLGQRLHTVQRVQLGCMAGTEAALAGLEARDDPNNESVLGGLLLLGTGPT